MFGGVSVSQLTKTILLLICSNILMTFAWYGHLRTLQNKSLYIAILVSWMIALGEYCLMVPANRIGFNQAGLSLFQLKIIHEVITLSVFMPFAVLFMHQQLNWNFFCAALCLCAAVYFVFRQ